MVHPSPLCVWGVKSFTLRAIDDSVFIRVAERAPYTGSTTPLVATYLVERTADDVPPVYYLMAASILSFLAIRGLREGAGKPLL